MSVSLDAARGAALALAPAGDLDGAIARAADALLARQRDDGHFCFELEADCTIPAEYILMMHFMDEIGEVLEAKIARFLREHQNAEGGWPLFHGGPFDLSCTIKAYYALKLAGDDPTDPHMARARDVILGAGGAARANVFTRYMLAMFGQVPWRAVPFVPVEIMLLPKWFPFHIRKVSYWSRTVMIPLSVLYTLRARARNPRGIGLEELFVTPPEAERDYFPVRSMLNRVLLGVERAARHLEPLIPKGMRRRALRKAEDWFVARLNGDSGLGAIFPAMVNAYEAMHWLGYAPDHPLRVTARRAIDKLLIVGERTAYCQPCMSPVWDTALAGMALQEVGEPAARTAARRALDWLKPRQLLTQHGDWKGTRPELAGGGWPFQYANDHYPDLDDTAAVAWAMHRDGDAGRYANSIERAARWLAGMQSRNGGFASFDADNTCYYLNEIPFADHGALLDPPTADVTARCVALFGRLRRAELRRYLERALAFLRSEQEPDGCWFGRWGTNYIYGTWSVLSALEEAGVDPDDPMIRRAVAWLKAVQREDGGWGEDNDTYYDSKRAGQGYAGTVCQTAWALLALIAAGEADAPEVARGVAFLLSAQGDEGGWHDPQFNAPGFPRVFYLRYHGYDDYFPLWALARYRRATQERLG